MQSLAEVITEDFQRAVTTERLRGTQTIFLALTAGAILFSVVVVFLFLNGKPRQGAGGMLMIFDILTALNVAAAVVFPIVGKFVSEKQFSPSNLSSATERDFHNERGQFLAESPADKCALLIRISWIMQLAALEGSAFFGLVVSMNAVKTGVAYLQPMYMANMLAIIPLIVYVFISFPTTERFKDIFESKIRNRM